VKTAKMIKEEPLKDNKIIKYFNKGMEENKVFKPTRSLATSPIKARKQEVDSISEVDTMTELSDSGSEMIRTEEQLRKRAIINSKATEEKQVIGEDNIVIKFSEWQQMTMLISEVCIEIQGVIN
jgi:hypothetical protein